MDKILLKRHEQKLARHVAAGHGKETLSTLREKAEGHEVDAMAHDMDGDNVRKKASVRRMDHYYDLHNDLKNATKAVNKYGQGHNMEAHGEGKPYGSKD